MDRKVGEARKERKKQIREQLPKVCQRKRKL